MIRMTVRHLTRGAVFICMEQKIYVDYVSRIMLRYSPKNRTMTYKPRETHVLPGFSYIPADLDAPDDLPLSSAAFGDIGNE